MVVVDVVEVVCKFVVVEGLVVVADTVVVDFVVAVEGFVVVDVVVAFVVDVDAVGIDGAVITIFPAPVGAVGTLIPGARLFA